MAQCITALEGIVHAGKTTLMRSIASSRRDVCCIEEYTVYRGKQSFPTFPHTSSDALGANQFFVNLDARRFADIDNSHVVLLDRSCVSVLAYHYATELMTSGRVQCFDQSLELFRNNHARFIPQIVIYIDITINDLVNRHVGDGGEYKEILLNRAFNEHLRAFYDDLRQHLPNVALYRLDGRLPASDVLSKANAIIDGL